MHTELAELIRRGQRRRSRAIRHLGYCSGSWEPGRRLQGLRGPGVIPAAHTPPPPPVCACILCTHVHTCARIQAHSHAPRALTQMHACSQPHTLLHAHANTRTVTSIPLRPLHATGGDRRGGTISYWRGGAFPHTRNGRERGTARPGKGFSRYACASESRGKAVSRRGKSSLEEVRQPQPSATMARRAGEAPGTCWASLQAGPHSLYFQNVRSEALRTSLRAGKERKGRGETEEEDEEREEGEQGGGGRARRKRRRRLLKTLLGRGPGGTGVISRNWVASLLDPPGKQRSAHKLRCLPVL